MGNQNETTTTYPKGCIGNPYSYSEYRYMLTNKSWLGGFVQVENDEIRYYRAFDWSMFDGSNSDDGSGCDEGCGCGCDEGCGCGCDEGCGCGNDEDEENGSGSIDESLFGPNGGVHVGCPNSAASNDCLFKCLEYASNLFNTGYTSEQLRLLYLTGDRDTGWEGTNDVYQYMSGVNAYGENNTYNNQILDFSSLYFKTSTEYTTSISDLRTYLNQETYNKENSAVVAIFRQTDDENDRRFHAVIVESDNRGLLYIHDPQNHTYTSQGNDDCIYKSRRFMFSFVLEKPE
ncbi:MAG: hypothetical protein ACI4B5_06525 [Bacteroidaceae bacterium]